MTIIRSLRSIFSQRGSGRTRCLLTVSGTAVGVFAVVLISVIGSVGTAEVSRTLTAMGVDTLLIQPAGNTVSVTLTDKEVAAARKISGVDDVMPLMASATEIKMLGRRLDCYVWGVDKSADRLISLEALHGRLINDPDSAARSRVCVIDEQFALKTYGRSNITGKKLMMFLGGRYHEFEIVGIAKSGLSSLQNMLTNIMPGFVYVPITTMQQLCGRHTYDRIAVRLRDTDPDTRVDPAVITSELGRINRITDGYTCNDLLAQKSRLDDILAIVTAALSLVAGISLIVSGISVMTTMMMSASERSREIGIKKAIGAKSRSVCAEFLAESIFLTLSGSAAGITAALITARIGCAITGVPFTVSLGSLVMSALAAAATGAVFGAYPAVRAAGLDPAEALRM